MSFRCIYSWSTPVYYTRFHIANEYTVLIYSLKVSPWNGGQLHQTRICEYPNYIRANRKCTYGAASLIGHDNPVYHIYLGIHIYLHSCSFPFVGNLTRRRHCGVHRCTLSACLRSREHKIINPRNQASKQTFPPELLTSWQVCTGFSHWQI